MKINTILIHDPKHNQLCKRIFKLLNCNLLWIILGHHDMSNIFVTDTSILEHYYCKKYYLHDPSLNIEDTQPGPLWRITLGTDCNAFTKTGFLYDLDKIFNVEEFVSIEKRTESEHICFRFFTKNNRYVFINKLLNDMSIIKYSINAMIDKLKDIQQHSDNINTTLRLQ